MKDFLFDLFTNPIFLSAGGAWFLSQGSKVILSFAMHGFSAQRFVGGGGMPSAHSATVTGLIVSTALSYGVAGFEFPMALFFGIIVIYDAMGVRLTTGRQSHILNRMKERDAKEGRSPVQEKNLDEMMGHSLAQIIVGIIIGAATALLVQVILQALHLQ